MKSLYVPILLSWTALLLFHSPAFSDIRLPIPSAIKNLNKQNTKLLQLKKLLDEDSIISFYQEADKMLTQADRYSKKEVTPQELTDGLFLCYLIATAPFIDVNRHSNVVWLMNYTDLDYEVKDFMSSSVPFTALTDKRSNLPGKEEALRFYLTARALVLQQFRSSFDHAFEATWICSEMLLDHAPQLTGDREAAGEFANRLATNEARNNKLKNIIPRRERIFVRELMQCFPSKAVEVKKYLRMAGYSDKEIPALLDRTVGRVPEAQYLYKGLPKRRD
ncbi:hypothetical protein [Akkermansia sp.]|uniref:hypothetical protein n=1 Tax=Akkermansia sp. TaxID=1872421 RepID=UPI0025C0C83F|nr:hypothetical protein [Akkermansia sp.]MCC8149008.1 hypothetical protein [Akkermansia sp.]